MLYRNLSLLLLMVVAIAVFVLRVQDTGPEAMVMPMDTRLRAHPIPMLDSETSFFLDPGTTLDIIGRTADQAWVQVYAEEVGEGWVLSEFIMVFIDLPPIPITTDLGALSRGYALPPDVVEQNEPGFLARCALLERRDAADRTSKVRVDVRAGFTVPLPMRCGRERGGGIPVPPRIAGTNVAQREVRAEM